MADFVDVGGVKILVASETWAEEITEVGDQSELSMTGRPIESRSALVRLWTGQGTRTSPAKDSIASANRPAYWEGFRRWIEGWGQFFPTLAGVAASGLVLGNQVNVAAGQITSGNFVYFSGQYAMRVRRGFTVTSKTGWSFGFKRTFIGGEVQAAGSHWCVATGKTAFTQGVAANPAGIVQYVDGAASNFNVGNLADVNGSQFQIYGKKTDNTNSAITYSDLFFLPLQLPSSWVSQIYTNLISAGFAFPSLPRQKLSGQWLINEDNPVEVLGHVQKIQQRVGFLAGDSAQSNDLRELAFTFTEA